MKLIITVREPTKKARIIEILVSENTNLKTIRELWDVEQVLNNLPGSKVRWHFNFEE